MYIQPWFFFFLPPRPHAYGLIVFIKVHMHGRFVPMFTCAQNKWTAVAAHSGHVNIKNCVGSCASDYTLLMFTPPPVRIIDRTQVWGQLALPPTHCWCMGQPCAAVVANSVHSHCTHINTITKCLLAYSIKSSSRQDCKCRFFLFWFTHWWPQRSGVHRAIACCIHIGMNYGSVCSTLYTHVQEPLKWNCGRTAKYMAWYSTRQRFVILASVCMMHRHTGDAHIWAQKFSLLIFVITALHPTRSLKRQSTASPQSSDQPADSGSSKVNPGSRFSK